MCAAGMDYKVTTLMAVLDRIRLDEVARYLIESAGWKMLRANSFYPTVWVEKRPARDTTMPPAMDSEE